MVMKNKLSPCRAAWAHWVELISVNLSQVPAYTARLQILG